MLRAEESDLPGKGLNSRFTLAENTLRLVARKEYAMSESKPANPLLSKLETTPEGLTLRDWMAGQALAGFSRAREAEMFNENTVRWYARIAYEMADAMLEERVHAPRKPVLNKPAAEKPAIPRPQRPAVWQDVKAGTY